MSVGFADCSGKYYSVIYKVRNCSNESKIIFPEKGASETIKFTGPTRDYEDFKRNLDCENLRHYEVSELREAKRAFRDDAKIWIDEHDFVGTLKNDKCSIYVASYSSGPNVKLTDADLKLAKVAFDNFISLFAKEGKFEIDLDGSKMNYYEDFNQIKKECELLAPIN